MRSLAMDWAGDNIYLADVTLQSILACSLRSRRCVVVVDNVVGPIAVDSNNA